MPLPAVQPAEDRQLIDKDLQPAGSDECVRARHGALQLYATDLSSTMTRPYKQ